MTTARVSGLILTALVITRTDAHAAGVVYFGDIHANIEASGQSVIGTASTYEAVVLFKTADGSGVLFEEIEPFGEDKFLELSPGGAVYGYNYPVNYPDVLSGLVSVTLDTWHHAAYVYDGAEERVYLDGVLLASRAASGDVNDAVGLAYIGANPPHSSTSFIGLLDSVRLSDVARYTGASFTPPVGDLTSDANTLLLYNFNDPPGSATISDSGPLGRTGTPGSISGGPAPVSCGSDPTDLVPDACDPSPPTTTTTTTLPPTELCGNCVDDDLDGDTDFEDSDCCTTGQTATLTLKKGLLKPGAGSTKLALAATLSAAGLASGTTATQGVFVQVASGGTEVLCARVPATSLTRKKNSVAFSDPAHAVASALGVDRLLVSQKKRGGGRLKAGGKQVTLAPPEAGRVDVVLGLRDPNGADTTNACAKGSGTFRAAKKGVLKFP